MRSPFGNRSLSVAATLMVPLALVGAPVCLWAQATTRLLVGSPEIRPTITKSHTSYTLSPPAPATPTILEESVYPDTRDGRRVLIKATTETSVDGVGGDTLTMDASSLAPLALVTFGGGRTRRFRFDGGHITAEIIEAHGVRSMWIPRSPSRPLRAPRSSRC